MDDLTRAQIKLEVIKGMQDGISNPTAESIEKIAAETTDRIILAVLESELKSKSS